VVPNNTFSDLDGPYGFLCDPINGWMHIILRIDRAKVQGYLGISGNIISTGA
jgi:hypothetical protein